MTAAAPPGPRALPLPGGREGATVEVQPLLMAQTRAPTAFFDRPRNPIGLLPVLAGMTERVWIPIPAFLVRHPGAGPLLIDAGMHPSVVARPTDNLGPVTGRLAPIRMSLEQTALAQLRGLGVQREEVHTVVMTHLHYDHASGLSELPEATVVVDGRELRAARSGGWRDGYVAGHIAGPYDWLTIDFDADEATRHDAFSRTVDLFGDGSVRLLSTPGHSAGHLSLLLRLSAGELLLTGDAIYSRESLRDDLQPMFCADRTIYRASRGEIRAYAEGHPDTPIVPGHDPVAWAQLPERFD